MLRDLLISRRLPLLALCLITFLTGCGAPPDVRRPEPEVQTSIAIDAALWSQAQSVFEHRCVVCHGCYDAPCQFKVENFDGLNRGASKQPVYDPSRLTAATPTRLGIDATGRAAWRELGFFPVLPEGRDADPRASLLLRAVALGREHPLEPDAPIGEGYHLGINREHSCPTATEYDDFAREHPDWGMPFALPALTEEEERSLVEWVRAGAPHAPTGIEKQSTRDALNDWETFLNGKSNKQRLVARYIYEHLFFATLRFEDGEKDERPESFRLVRSRTRTGAVDEVSTRRPFDDPGSERVYYRFVLRRGTVVEKSLMPYALTAEKKRRYQELFFEKPYDVNELPGYSPEIASNPFRVFAALPVESRYRFMLEEAQFTLMGFIKGPVCRGQVALNVIEDRFFVFFVDPTSLWMEQEAQFLAASRMDQEMPAASGSNAWPTMWLGYGEQHGDYMRKKAEYLEQAMRDGRGLSERSVWDGEGKNDNAALTVFRHFDSATVVKGLVGPETKTMWLVDYPLLERIHYLLVAGFDVFGNVTHQLATRLYMDYLRMEAEAGFLSLLPVSSRDALVRHWYRGITGDRKARVQAELTGQLGEPAISYERHDAKAEALAWLSRRVSGVLDHTYDVSRATNDALTQAARAIASAPADAATELPEASVVVLEGASNGPTLFTVLRDTAHSNVAELFDEEERRLPREDRLVVARGVLGAYPNALFVVRPAELDRFAAALRGVKGRKDYLELRAGFGMRRSSPEFWRVSDALQLEHVRRSPLSNGILDYSRLHAD